MPKIEKGKSICITSMKGGVGKTTTTLNLAGAYSLLNMKCIILDLDLGGGGVALSLNLEPKKNIYNVCYDMMNNSFKNIREYITPYNKNIDIISAPKDPRQALKIDPKYIDLILYNLESIYDVVLIDTTHSLSAMKLTIMDRAYNNLFIITNDPTDLKNTKSIISIFKDNEINNYNILLNNSCNLHKDYFSLYEIKNIIKANIDFTISKNYYFKNIDNYVMDGKILILDKKIQNTKKKDVNNIIKMAKKLIKE